MEAYNQKFYDIAHQMQQGIVQAAEKAKYEWKLRQYFFTIANMQNLLPELFEHRSGEEVFVDYLIKKSLAPLDQQITERVYELRMAGDFVPVLKDRISPRIFCAFHLGSYRTIIGCLARLGYNFSLVVNNDLFTKQKEEIFRSVATINQLYGHSSNFDVLNAEQLGTATLIAKKIEEGQSIIIYADGNTGTGGTSRQDEKLLKVNFLEQKVFVRMGIPYLAHLKQIPIVPVVSPKDGFVETLVHFYPSIHPRNDEKRAAFCSRVMQTLYDLLAQNLVKYPLQWEGWLSIHKQLDLDHLSEKIQKTVWPVEALSNTLTVNDQRFGLYEYGSNYYLFDMATYRTYPITAAFFEKLRPYWAIGRAESDRKSLSIEEEVELLQKDVLVPLTNHSQNRQSIS